MVHLNAIVYSTWPLNVQFTFHSGHSRNPVLWEPPVEAEATQHSVRDYSLEQ